tara:strand:+ start:201 stop:2573 length:2373 start_codon:yes stop_codon:yes gene_type:complete
MSKQFIVEIKVEDGQAKTKLNSLNKDLGTTATQATKTGAALNEGFGLLPGNVQLAITRVRSLNVSLKALAVGGIVAGIGAVGSLFAAAARKGAEFDKAMSGVQAVTNGTEEEMNALASTSKRLGSTTAFTAMQVAELETELAKLGFPVSDIVEMSEATLNLASSMGIGLGEAAAFTGSTLRAFGLEATESKKVIDILAQSTASSALDFGKLNTALSTVAPIAKTAGVSLSDTTAMLGTLANSGFEASTSGTMLRNIFLKLAKEGITMEEAFAKINSATEKNVVAQELFDTRAAAVAITLAENADATADLKQQLDGASESFDGLGAAAGIAETRLDNLAGDTTKLNSAWEGFLLSIEDGDGILNRIARTFTQELTASIERFRKGLAAVTAIFDELGASFNVFGRIGDQFKKTTLLFQAGATNIKLALSGIPFIGDSFDRTALEKELQEYRKAFLALELRTQAQNKIRETRNKQGTFFERVSARIAKAEEAYSLALENSNKSAQQNNENIDETIEKETDLIKLLEQELELAKQMPGTTKAEIAARNDAINAINEEIKALKELSLIKSDAEKFADMQIPRMQTRAAQTIKTENTVTANLEKQTPIRQRNYDQEYDSFEKLQDLKVEAAITGFNTIASLARTFAGKSEKQQKRAFKIEKAANIASALITTFNTANKAYASQFVPIPDPTSPVRGAIAAGIATATGLANVASIAAQKFESPSKQTPSVGGTEGSLGGGVTETQAPQFNLIGQSGFNQVAQAIGQQQPVQAFVVAQDVTTAQQLNNNIISAATVGG